MTLSESEYDQRAQPELRALIEAIDALDSEALEAELSSDILSLEFSDGSKYVVNSHRAARQIWMAAISTAWHFDPVDGGGWRASKSGDELRSTIARLVKERVGLDLSF